MADPFDLGARRRERIERQYRELKAVDPEAYRECVEVATGISLNFAHKHQLDDNARNELGAELESALVAFAHRRIA